MKILLRAFLINVLAFLFVWQYVPTVVLEGGFEDVLLAAAALTALDKFLKPLLKMVLIPVNMVTFGLLRWVAAVIVFYITTEVIEGLNVVSWQFPGLSTPYIVFPAYLISFPLDYVVSALIVVLLVRIFTWVFKRKPIK